MKKMHTGEIRGYKMEDGRFCKFNFVSGDRKVLIGLLGLGSLVSIGSLITILLDREARIEGSDLHDMEQEKRFEELYDDVGCLKSEWNKFNHYLIENDLLGVNEDSFKETDV